MHAGNTGWTALPVRLIVKCSERWKHLEVTGEPKPSNKHTCNMLRFCEQTQGVLRYDVLASLVPDGSLCSAYGELSVRVILELRQQVCTRSLVEA
jgi:hypothetical protein